MAVINQREIVGAAGKAHIFPRRNNLQAKGVTYVGAPPPIKSR